MPALKQIIKFSYFKNLLKYRYIYVYVDIPTLVREQQYDAHSFTTV